jgi:hypothetical protein
MARIIDRDIAFYEGDKEEWKRKLRECAPNQELAYQRRLYATERVVIALEAYKEALKTL